MTERICFVELYGPARLFAGVKAIPIEVGDDWPLGRVVLALAAHYPALVGPVLDVERRWLADGYIFNRNGRDFLASPDATVQPGDRLLVLANSAGG